jgi:hypothetical protein
LKSQGYRFSSPTYPWMHGNVLVTDDISTVTTSHLKNNIDVQLSWSPSTPEMGQMTHFIITFTNKDSQESRPYCYSFAINDPTGKNALQYRIFSSFRCCVEQTSYTFRNPCNFISIVSIYGILFQPVNPDQAYFTLGTR